MTDEDVEVVERTLVYDGYVKVEKVRLRHLRHDGAWSGVMTRELIERGHAAAVLPYDPVRDEVVLIEQFRIGAHGAGRTPWQIEIVAGIIEPGETAEDVARRESIEECGCAVGDLVPICDMLLSPGVMTETIALYCGRTDASAAGGVHGLDHEDEDIRAFAVSADRAIDLVKQGLIGNAPAIVALQWLALNRLDLRRNWIA